MTPDTSLDDRLRALVAPLEAELDQLQAHRRNLIEQREKVDKDMHRITRAIKPLKPEGGASKNNSTKARPARSQVSDKNIEKVKEACLRLGKRDNPMFSKKNVQDESGVNGKAVNWALQVLRDDEIIGLAGRAGGRGGGYLYRVMPGVMANA